MVSNRDEGCQDLFLISQPFYKSGLQVALKYIGNQIADRSLLDEGLRSYNHGWMYLKLKARAGRGLRWTHDLESPHFVGDFLLLHSAT